MSSAIRLSLVKQPVSVLEDKPTCVSLLGLEKAKELAEEQYLVAAKAVEGLSEGLSGKERLIEIADFIIKRTH